jgi:hypothetical protein
MDLDCWIPCVMAFGWHVADCEACHVLQRMQMQFGEKHRNQLEDGCHRSEE